MLPNVLKSSVLGLCLFFTYVSPALAAVGCTLNDPDRDVKRMFPQSTGYTTEFITIREKGGDTLKREIEEKLNDKLDPVYESNEVEHAYYNVKKGAELIGRIHGITQKGVFGGMQLILATDLNGKVLYFYFQKLSSPDAKKFRDETFTRKFTGLTLTDFYIHVFKPGSAEDKIIAITSPSGKYEADFKNTIRGIMQNLIKLDIFYLKRSYDTSYKKIRGGK